MFCVRFDRDAALYFRAAMGFIGALMIQGIPRTMLKPSAREATPTNALSTQSHLTTCYASRYCAGRVISVKGIATNGHFLFRAQTHHYQPTIVMQGILGCVFIGDLFPCAILSSLNQNEIRLFVHR